MSYWLGVIGCWVMSDAIYSYSLYAHSQSWRGDRQTWVKDHWVRLIRLLLGIALIWIGTVIKEG